VSYYKIPSYFYEAAARYRNDKEYQKSVDLLYALIEQYPQSDEIEKANQLLFRNYVERAQEYASEFKYFEALEDYAIAQEIAYENNMEGLIDYYSNVILRGISVDILKNYAQSLFNNNQYMRSLYIYNNILENNPEIEEEINPLIAQCKIRIISDSDHKRIDDLGEVTIWSPENFTLILTNRSDVPIIFYIGRPDAQIMEIEPNSRIDITREAGTYEIAIEVEENSTPLYNSIGFEENKRYTLTYEQPEQ
jgi:tetratricopeptide (TPR) repeat protein